MEIEFWKLQHTGASSGLSWFDYGGPEKRFGTEAAARAAAAAGRCGFDGQWRLVHVSITKTEDKRVTVERFVTLPSELTRITQGAE